MKIATDIEHDIVQFSIAENVLRSEVKDQGHLCEPACEHYTSRG